MFWDGEEGEDLLGILEETDTAELVVGDATYVSRAVPLFGGINGYWLVFAHEVAYDFRTFCHKAVLTLAELLLFQLADIFYLIFANHFGFCLQR